jgi:hypothetical protein
MRISLEHLVMSASSASSLWLRSVRLDLPTGEDPVVMGFSFLPDALSHSTSWRSEQDALVLTFAHVVSDGTELEHAWSGSPEELEGLPSACHAVRHLHFLRFTDKEIAAYPGLDDFWTFAHAVADQHYPAVAGLLFQHGLAGGPDFVI